MLVHVDARAWAGGDKASTMGILKRVQPEMHVDAAVALRRSSSNRQRLAVKKDLPVAEVGNTRNPH